MTKLELYVRRKGEIQRDLMGRNTSLRPTPESELCELRQVTSQITRLKGE